MYPDQGAWPIFSRESQCLRFVQVPLLAQLLKESQCLRFVIVSASSWACRRRIRLLFRPRSALSSTDSTFSICGPRGLLESLLNFATFCAGVWLV